MDSGNISEWYSGSKKRIYGRIVLFFLFLFFTGLPSVSSDPAGENSSAENNIMKEAEDPFRPLSDERIAILESAFSFIGIAAESTHTIMGEEICFDCIGTVAAVYLDAGYDFRDYVEGGYGSGVKNLYEFLKKNDAIYTRGLPRPGDIVFWDNTWDANGDGDHTNDLCTHAGVVIKAEEDGTVHYLHAHIRRGVIVQKMNRYSPEYYSGTGEVINNAMAMNSGISSENNPEKWTSGHLWAAYGSILDAILNNE